MPDLWVDVDTTVTVPVNILPLLDDTDFKTIEQDITYNATGMDLVWNFQTAAGATSCTSVTPTTGGGDHDWAETVANKGMYKIGIPASGGDSISNDTEGVGWFTGVATGVLPWRGPTIGFRRAALNDLLMDGGTASTNLEDFFDGTGYVGGTAKLGVDVIAISGDTNSADNLEAATDGNTYNVGGGAIVAASVTGAVGSVTGAVGSVTGAVGSVTGPVGSVTGFNTTGSGLSAIPWNAAWDAEVQSEATDALNAYDPPTHAELTTAVANVSVDELQASALADLFNTNSGTTYGAAVAGSAVKEIADNAGGASITEASIDAQLSATHGAGAWGAGTGATSQVYNVTVGGLPADGVYCRMTTDATGLINVAAGTTDAAGNVTFWHNLASGTTVYIWRVKAGVAFTDPDTEAIP